MARSTHEVENIKLQFGGSIAVMSPKAHKLMVSSQLQSTKASYGQWRQRWLNKLIIVTPHQLQGNTS